MEWHHQFINHYNPSIIKYHGASTETMHSGGEGELCPGLSTCHAQGHSPPYPARMSPLPPRLHHHAACAQRQLLALRQDGRTCSITASA